MKLFNKTALKNAATTAAQTAAMTTSLATIGYLFFQAVKAPEQQDNKVDQHLKRHVFPRV